MVIIKQETKLPLNLWKKNSRKIEFCPKNKFKNKFYSHLFLFILKLSVCLHYCAFAAFSFIRVTTFY